ncbi:MAG TPA: hypothetical protein VFS43_18450 [Polyangiaceae bacterium]|nr:hypothetical protein [Polyangiaceae bacterium]
MWAAALTVGALAIASCGDDDDEGGEGAPGGGSGAATGGAGGTNGAPGGGGTNGAPGGGGTNGAPGGGTGGGGGRGGGGDASWQRAFAEVGFAVEKVGDHACSASAEALAQSELPRVSAGGATIYVGFHQVSSDNQDPFAARVEGGQVTWCVYHEDDGPDGRALGIAWDGGPFAYVVYTIVGGGTDLEMPGWFRSYGGHAAISGGNKKVGVLGRVDAATGALVAATHVPAVLSDRKVNSHAPVEAPVVLADGTVEYRGESAHKPIGADGKNPMDCTDYPFTTTYRFAPDLASLTCAVSTNCTGNTKPCE